MFVKRALAATLALGILASAAPVGAWAQPAAATVAAGPVVKTKQGAVRGTVVDGVARFQGIPFAAAPVGDLRWKAPAAAPTWTAERDATKPGADCTQAEDCLFVNVTRPANAKPGAKLPVMVWIHGGAFVTGNSIGAFGAQHNGEEFAKQGVITVTLNYRLGRAGWFAHPALTKEGGAIGNYGLMDQIAALKWVQANIGAFGGDAKNVTIFGESAGGISVFYLMLAPEARGLFHKAISESGFARHQPATLQAAEALGLKAAQAAGVPGDDAAALGALRKLPITAMPYTEPFTNRAQPILDGRYITTGITEGFAAGKQAKIPLMLGGNSNEASLFRPVPAQLDLVPEAARPAMMAAFDPENSGDKSKVVHRLVTNQLITEPDRNLARIQSKAGQRAYLYYFSYVTPAEREKSLGAAHAAEIKYVWGGAAQKFAPEDLAPSKAMNAYWAAFAKSGDPGAAGGPRWPAFAPKESSIEFGVDGVKVHEQHLKARLDLVEQMQPKR